MARWSDDPRTKAERGYGPAWVRLRKRIMQRDAWLCQPCLGNDRIVGATEVDHITPKAEGGTDSPANLQAICKPCHAAKTAVEAARGQDALRAQGRMHAGHDGWIVKPKRWGYSIPDGVKQSAIPVTIVAGPPASGKSTYVEKHAARTDFVIDLDQVMVRIGGVQWDSTTSVIKRALRYRDMMIRSLATKPAGKAWLIISAPTRAERAMWIKALGPQSRMVVMDTPIDTCRQRIADDPRRKASMAKQLEVVARWEPDLPD